MRGNIDIVIPVYNALDCLTRCVDSLLRHTDFSAHRLILVNDGSPDARVGDYLADLAAKHKDFVVHLENEGNKGYTATVNRGAGYSKNDVVLLNSDTIVTKRWLEKLADVAYESASTGTVTPISNNATICSVPNPDKDNELPPETSIDEFAEIVERVCLQPCDPIPVAVGFCMFIKREVFDEIGYFDQETFPRGYAEELDFCFRASQAGWQHVKCNNTFVYHEGTMSFEKKEKTQLQKSGEQYLYKLYADQMATIPAYCLGKKYAETAENIKLHLAVANKRKNLLYLLQSDFRVDAVNHVGGTQFHVNDLMKQLRGEYNVHVVARDDNCLRLTIYTEKDMYSFKFFIGPPPSYPLFSDQKQRQIYAALLDVFRIDAVHIHHTLGLSQDLFFLAQERGIPLFLTLHDYYYVCPSLKLLDRKGKACPGAAQEHSEELAKQTERELGVDNGEEYLKLWWKRNEKVMRLCDRIFVPSESAKSMVSDRFPDLSERLIVMPHGTEIFPLPDKSDLSAEKSGDIEFAIEKVEPEGKTACIISGIAYQKNADSINSDIRLLVTDKTGRAEIFPASKKVRADLYATDPRYIYSGFSAPVSLKPFSSSEITVEILIENGGKTVRSEKKSPQKTGTTYQRPPKKPLCVAFIGGMNEAKGSRAAVKMIKNGPKDVEWYVFGGIGDGDLLFLKQDNLTKIGWYERKQLPSLVRQFEIDLICILPTWSETFCYTLSEALDCDTPLIVTDIGAVGERARQMPDCCWIVDLCGSAESALEIVGRIKDFPPEYTDKKAAAERIKMKTVEQMAREYSAEYKTVSREQISYNTPDFRLIFDAYLTKYNPDVASSSVHSGEYARLVEAEAQLKAINASITYKAVLAVAKLPIPFKRQLKALLYKVYKLFRK